MNGRFAQEEAGNHNLLSAEGRRAFRSRLHSQQLQRERDEAEDQQEML